MSSPLRRPTCAAVIMLVACTDVGQQEMPRADPGAAVTVAADENDDAVRPARMKKRRLPMECAHDIDFRDWLWEPSLSPVDPRPINPRNSAFRVHRLRDRIVRVEVVHARTYRALFELDNTAMEALRKVPDGPFERVRRDTYPACCEDWPVVFLIYVDGEELPYLGHPLAGDLYFAGDGDPWHFYVFVDKGQFRKKLSSMPLDLDLYLALEDKLGRPDPYGKRTTEAKVAHHNNCGRENERPPVPEPPNPFPNIPRAVIGGAKQKCPHATKPSLAPIERPLININNSAQHFQSVRRDLHRVDVIQASTHRVLFSLDSW